MSDVQEPIGVESDVPDVVDESAADNGGLVESDALLPLPPAEIPQTPHRVVRPRRRPSFFWPLVLVGAGAILLLSNLGYLPWSSWGMLWRLWPLFLIALGVDLLIGRRSLIGAIVSAFLILLLIGGGVAIVFFAQNIPMLVEVTGPVEWRTEHVEYPLEGVERASVMIDWTSVPGYLSALRDSSDLIQADVTYLGELTFDVEVYRDEADVTLDSHFTGLSFGTVDVGRGDARWDVKLNPRTPLDLTLDTGSGACDFDLTGLQISGLVLDSGSGSIDLALPADSTFEAVIDSGSGSIVITLPEGVGARVNLDSGSGSFQPGERFRLIEGERNDDSVWETDDFRTAEHTVLFYIDQGSGSIRIR